MASYQQVRDMKRNKINEQNTIVAISMISPLPVIIIGSLLYGLEFIVIAIAPYSIMVFATLVLMFLLSALFKNIKLHTFTRLFVSCTTGLVLGGLFFNFIRHNGLSIINFGDDSMITGSIMGLITSFFSFILYTYGRLKIKVK